MSNISELKNNVRHAMSLAQEEMKKLPQVNIEAKHVFVNGMCTRTIMIPKGTTLIGAIHLTDHVNIMCGDITIYSEMGQHRLTGYHVIPSESGTKRMGFAHEDTCWTTILKTDLTSAQEVEKLLTAEDYNDERVISLDKRKIEA